MVENDDLIGTLIETNERVIAAIEMYDHHLSGSDISHGVSSGLVPDKISAPRSEANLPRERDFQKSDDRNNDLHLHPDLHDLNFGSLGASSTKLPPPIRPSALSDDGQEQYGDDKRGSLSDFSDYESSEEDTRGASGKRGGRSYVHVSDDPDDETFVGSKLARTHLTDAEDLDPFADPFADSAGKS